ncbi:MAG TPA: ATP-binding cassette domain-containing protein [Candidatus Xenobia bacterium]
MVVVEHLSKRFYVYRQGSGRWAALRHMVMPERRAVDALVDVSITITRGELVGYIGPNGAGKSTTVKILSGILVPDGGRCEVMGRVPWRQRAEHVRDIGVVFGQRTQLWWDLPVMDSFELLRDIYRVESKAWRSALDELVARLDLGNLLDVPVRQLSLGQRMRCDLAGSLLHRPPLLFLDEPTIGLDAVSKLQVRDFIQKINRENQVTVILTTHDMDDIEALCPRVVLISGGRVLSDGPLTALRQAVGAERWLTIDLAEPVDRVEDEQAEVMAQDGLRVRLRFNPDVVAPAVLVSRLANRYPLRDLYVENPPIESVVAELYKKT